MSDLDYKYKHLQLANVRGLLFVSRQARAERRDRWYHPENIKSIVCTSLLVSIGVYGLLSIFLDGLYTLLDKAGFFSST